MFPVLQMIAFRWDVFVFIWLEAIAIRLEATTVQTGPPLRDFAFGRLEAPALLYHACPKARCWGPTRVVAKVSTVFNIFEWPPP